MKKVLYRIALILISLAGAVLLVAVSHYDFFPLKESVCSAAGDPLEIPVEEYVKPHIDQSVLKYPSDHYLDTIFENYPQIESATINLNPAGKVTFDYDLKTPVVYLSLDVIYGLTARGELVPANGYNLPIVSGLKLNNPRLYCPLNNSQIAYTLKLARIISSLPPEIKKEVSIIDISDTLGLTITMDDIDPLLVMGHGNEVKKFLMVERMNRFLKTLPEDIIVVDFRFDDQVVLKRSF